MEDFWDDAEYSLRDYVNPPPSDELIKSIEEELGYKLPASYIELMKLHNGGLLNDLYIARKQPPSSTSDIFN